jgi:hypothetical protein
MYLVHEKIVKETSLSISNSQNFVAFQQYTFEIIMDIH